MQRRVFLGLIALTVAATAWYLAAIRPNATASPREWREQSTGPAGLSTQMPGSPEAERTLVAEGGDRAQGDSQDGGGAQVQMAWGIVVRVEDENGARVRGATVSWERDGQRAVAEVAPQSSLRLVPAAPGSICQIEVEAPGYMTERLLVEGGLVRKELRVVLRWKSGVGGSVVRDAPVSGATLRVYAQGESGKPVSTGVSDDDGRFWVSVPTPGEYTLSARKEGLGACSLVVQASERGGGEDVLVVLQGGSWLSGRAADAEGRSLEGAKITGFHSSVVEAGRGVESFARHMEHVKTLEGREGQLVFTIDTDHNGRFKATGLCDGRWMLFSRGKWTYGELLTECRTNADDLLLTVDERVVICTLQIVMPDGSTPQSATIIAERSDGLVGMRAQAGAHKVAADGLYRIMLREGMHARVTCSVGDMTGLVELVASPEGTGAVHLVQMK